MRIPTGSLKGSLMVSRSDPQVPSLCAGANVWHGAVPAKLSRAHWMQNNTGRLLVGSAAQVAGGGSHLDLLRRL